MMASLTELGISFDPGLAQKIVQVFESVIAWIQHSVEARAQHLPSLMEHIRLPLLSQDYLIHKVCFNKVSQCYCFQIG